MRLQFIDIAKGLGIILIVFGHNPYVLDSHGKLFNVIFSFHVPLFFFLSGYFCDPSINIRELIVKKSKSLLKPYFVAMVVVLVLYKIIKKDFSLLDNILYTIYGNGPYLVRSWMSMWFLPHLFIVFIFAWLGLAFLKKYLHNESSFQLPWLFFLICLLVIGTQSIKYFWDVKISMFSYIFFLKGLPWSVDLVFLSSFYFIIGYFAKLQKKELFDNKYIFIISLIIFSTIHYFFNFITDFNLRRYDNIFGCTVLAVTGIYLTVFISVQIAKSSNILNASMDHIGQSTLLILIFHNVIQYKLYYLLSSYSLGISLVPSLISLIAAVGIPLLFNKAVAARAGWVRYSFYAK